MKMHSALAGLRDLIRDPVFAKISLHATAGAYYLFFSLGPLVVLLLALVPYLPITEDRILELVTEFTPDAFDRLIHTIIGQVYAGSSAAVGASLVIELWSAGKFIAGLMRGIGEIYDGGRPAGFFRRRIFGALFTLALILLFLASILLTVFGESALRLAEIYIPPLARAVRLILRLHWPVFLAGMTLIFALMFRYIPRATAPFPRHLPGAFLAAVGWLGFSEIFSFFAERFRFFSVYGSLAIILLSMFWMYCSLYILFFGAWLNTQPGSIRPPSRNI